MLPVLKNLVGVRRTISLIVLASVMISSQVSAADTEAERLRLAAEVVEISQGEQMAQSMITAMLPLQLAQLRKAHPKLTDKQYVIVEEVLRDELKFVVEDAIAQFVPIYAETFSAKELQDIVSFYKSDTGQRMLEEMPALQQRGMQVGLGAAIKRMPEMVQRLKSRLSNKGIDL